MTLKESPFVAALVLTVAVHSIAASPARAENWPQWQGPKRDNISRETGLLSEWPTNGPTLLWTASGCGRGYSTVAVSDRMVYTSGSFSNGTFILAFGLDGKPAWRKPNGGVWQAGPRMSWAKAYDGARSTPTVDGNVVYHLGELGSLTALDAETGAPVWSRNIAEQFAAKVPNYGYTESVLIDGDRLICCPGGSKGYIVALDKKTGTTVWTNTNLVEGMGFSSPILAEHGGMRQIVTMSEEGPFGVDAATGELLWKYPFTNKRKNNIPTPQQHEDSIFVSTGYGAGSALIKLSEADGKVTPSELWKNSDLDNMYGGFMLVDGYVYGAAYEKPAWICLELRTGKPQYNEAADATGSATWADGMLYCLSHKGKMALAPCTPRGYKPVSVFNVPDDGGKDRFWACPVISGARLYVRHVDHLYAYDIRNP